MSVSGIWQNTKSANLKLQWLILHFPLIKSVQKSQTPIDSHLPVFVFSEQRQPSRQRGDERWSLWFGWHLHVPWQRLVGIRQCRQWHHLHHWIPTSNISKWVIRVQQVKAAIVLEEGIGDFFPNVHPEALRATEAAPWCHNYSVSFVLGWFVWNGVVGMVLMVFFFLDNLPGVMWAHTCREMISRLKGRRFQCKLLNQLSFYNDIDKFT